MRITEYGKSFSLGALFILPNGNLGAKGTASFDKPTLEEIYELLPIMSREDFDYGVVYFKENGEEIGNIAFRAVSGRFKWRVRDASYEVIEAGFCKKAGIKTIIQDKYDTHIEKSRRED